MAKRKIHRMLAPNQAKRIQLVPRANVIKRLKKCWRNDDKVKKFVDLMFFKQPQPDNHGEQLQAGEELAVRIRR